MKHVAIAMLLVGSASHLQAEAVYLESYWSCAHWAEARNNGNARPLEQHAIGALNGMAMGAQKDVWRTPTPIEPMQLFYWIDVYCTENPLSHLMQAAASFVVERRGPIWNSQ